VAGGTVVRKALDALYGAAGVSAAVLIVAVAVLVLTQILSRLLDFDVPGVDDIAGYCLAGASFLALAPTLKHGAHIRVSLLIEKLGAAAARRFDLAAHVVGLLLTLYFFWACVDFVWDSYRFAEVSHGMIATPLWIPRLVLPAGLGVLVIAFVDELIRVARGGRPGAAGSP
jgi:TRAP-type C4-dicarboxylate transport system permease small subunit